MKNYFCLFYLVSLIGFSQVKDQEKISFNYSSGYYTNFKKWKEDGITGAAEISYKNKIIYSVNLIFGVGLSKNITNKNGYFQAFLESDILFGKELFLSKSISIQPQIGVGYLHFTNHFQEDKKNLIGLPIQFKILFLNKSHLEIGLIPRAIFNSLQNNYSLLFTFHFK